MTAAVEVEHVPSDGLDLAVRVAGPRDGPPVVLIHGFPDTGAIWASQIQHLAAAGHRVLAPDTRGCGLSGRPSDPTAYGMADLIGDVVAVCQALGVARPALVGHDLGAALTWTVGARLGSAVDRIAVLSVGYPAGFGEDDLAQLQRFWYMLMFLTDQAETYLSQDDWRGLRMLAVGHPDLAEVEQRFGDPAAITSALAWYRSNVNPAQFVRFDPGAPKVAVPTLALWSTGDAFLFERQMTRSARFVSATWEYHSVPDAGHWLQVDAADAVNGYLTDFLAAG